MSYWQELLSGLLIFLAGLLPGQGQLTDPAPERLVSATSTAEVRYVVDGDTIDVTVGGKEERVRYIGIDTPELAHGKGADDCFAVAASQANIDLVSGQIVTLVRDTSERDRYGRLLRYVYVGDTFVNQALVVDGSARAVYIKPDVKHYSEFKAADEAARAAGAGRWSACD